MDRRRTASAAALRPAAPERPGERTAERTVPERAVPEATVARLPVYLRALTGLLDRGRATVSSAELAAAAGVGPAMLRRDLSYLGSYGTRGVGYEVDYLRAQIERETGASSDHPVVVVGAGNLGSALAGYGGFRNRGFRVVGLLDADPARVGAAVGDLQVRPVEDLEAVVAEAGGCIGVVTTPAGAAQAVVDRLVAAGVRSVLSFAPALLAVPPGVELRRVDLSTELAVLAYHEQRRSEGGPLAALAGVPS